MRNICRCGSQDFNYLTSIPITATETRRYENQVAAIGRAELQATGQKSLIMEPVVLTASFYFSIPKGRRFPPDSKSKMALHEGDPHTQRPDVDNCLKSLLDGLNQTVITDDSIIHTLRVSKRWSLMPRAEVGIETRPARV